MCVQIEFKSSYIQSIQEISKTAYKITIRIEHLAYTCGCVETYKDTITDTGGLQHLMLNISGRQRHIDIAIDDKHCL